MKNDQSNTALSQLFDRIKNWKTVYENSIQGPKTGLGRLVLSRGAANFESSSGVSSDETSPIPQPPLPYGRIASFNVAAEVDPTPSPISIHPRPIVQKATIFSGAANITEPQMEAGVNVRIKNGTRLVTGTLFDDVPSKFVRDVATQIMVLKKPQQVQTNLFGEPTDSRQFGSQMDTKRVDSMTQIGCVKASRQQQVQSNTIIATMRTANAGQPSVDVAEESAHFDRKLNTFAVEAGTRVFAQDLQTQVNDGRGLPGQFVTREWTTELSNVNIGQADRLS